MKILVISHGHPTQSVGGGEVSAYNLYNAFSDRSDVSAATFLARTGAANLARGEIRPLNSNEYIWRQNINDVTYIRSELNSEERKPFRDFVATLDPDVVYMNHYVHIGVDFIREVRRLIGDRKIVLTLHEYMAICYNGGQMVTPETQALCDAASPQACHSCFPSVSPIDLQMRKSFLQSHFDLVDRLVTPSVFAKERYVSWGVAPEKIEVIENPLSAETRAARSTKTSDRVTLGFFGQVLPFKGLDLLMQAIHMLRAEERAQLRLVVNGANLWRQSAAFQERLSRLSVPLLNEKVLVWAGAYTQAELPRRQASMDWAVVPSLWWENSPMVIQEAFAARVPVIGANFGGIAEKIRDEVDGLLFDARNAESLAGVLRRVLTQRDLRDRLAANIAPPISPAEAAEKYLSIVC
jgi:glycosyltransferase involved in cell wall biosynthesis